MNLHPTNQREMIILAGDIGGTKTRLAFFKHDSAKHNGARFELIVEGEFPSREYGGLDEIVHEFTQGNRSVVLSRACFGVAGPVRGAECVTPNLPWKVRVADLSRSLSHERVSLINDLEATAHGIALLTPQDFVTLNEGARRTVHKGSENDGSENKESATERSDGGEAEVGHGNRAVIAAGTGLGEAGLYWDGAAHRPFACEGGHTDFAPRDELEAELFIFLRRRFGRVSYERVVSGQGLQNIYEFLRDEKGMNEPAWLAAQLAGDQVDAAALISQAAEEEGCAAACASLRLFVSLYGAEAGNLALKLMATGGVYVGGGIAPKLITKLASGEFMRAFLDKGRMRSLLEAVPVRVITNDRTALYGAASYSTISHLIIPNKG